MMSGAAPPDSGRRGIISALLAVSDTVAAILLAADLLVVCGSVLLRYLFNAPVEWADDVARGLMVGSSFFGAASALARSENLGVAFFIDMLPNGVRRVFDSVGALLVTVVECDRDAFRKRVLPQTDNFIKAHPDAKPVVDAIRATQA